MDTFPVDEWRPVFPDPAPPHWIAFVATGDGLLILTDVQLNPRLRAWLGKWLSAHSPHEPDAEASYVYLGLGSELGQNAPDGVKSPGGVTGVGFGIEVGEPPGASPSRVRAIVRQAIVELLEGTAI